MYFEIDQHNINYDVDLLGLNKKFLLKFSFFVFVLFELEQPGTLLNGFLIVIEKVCPKLIESDLIFNVLNGKQIIHI